jgi:hypothetical protein
MLRSGKYGANEKGRAVWFARPSGNEKLIRLKRLPARKGYPTRIYEEEIHTG